VPVAALLSALFLAGCTGAGAQKDDLPCPDTGLILAAAQMVSLDAKAAAAGKAGEEDIVVEATLADYRGACRWRQETLEFMLEVDVTARRGAAGTALRRARFPYFIAVLDPEENVLQRQGFSTTVSFDNNGTGLTTEQHILRLPMKDSKIVRLHKVVMGFELTPEQLAYNRRDEKPAAPALLSGKKARAAKE
jgi:hypothetical protein